CKDDVYILGTQKLNAAGIYQEVFVASNGCDSTVILDLKMDIVDVSITVALAKLSAAAGMSSYQWIDCDKEKTEIAGANQRDFVPKRSGNYAVIVGLGDCIDTSACQSYTATGINSASSTLD